jgi:myo-inositol-1(or 4)-monophosphatase
MLPTLPDLERLARQAGAILRAGYEGEHQVDYKGSIDLVTEVDHQSEAFLLDEIRRKYPGHGIVSEEAGRLPGSDRDCWYIDPLDGTVNYAHGIPIFTVSIAYAHKGAVMLGAVYDPLRDELYSAEHGQGARRNGDPIGISSVSEIRRSLLVTGFAYDVATSARNNLDNFARFMRLSQGVRRLGSAALDLCYIASGRFDGYWELSLNPWDLAAGGLIASEAGALVTDLTGGPDYLAPPCGILAAPPALHAKMLAVLSKEE